MSLHILSHNPAREAEVNMVARQTPLMKSYVTNPERAWIVDSAQTSSTIYRTDDAIHTQVNFGRGRQANQPIGVHKAVGGECDLPNPGEVLSAALASCLDTTIRIIANRLDVKLNALTVTVDAHVDVRGTLRVNEKTPVGFQSIDVRVDIEPAGPVPQQHLSMLVKAAEKSCVVLQTLRNSPKINIDCNPIDETMVAAQ